MSGLRNRELPRRILGTYANENRAFLSRYPKIPGYPYLFALDADGKLLRPKRTIEFEDGNTYKVPRFVRFLTVCGPHRRLPVN
jgi:hypothetical protein